MKVVMCIGVTAVVDLDERMDGTMKIEMMTPKLNISAVHVPTQNEEVPSPQTALDYNTVALDHVLNFLSKGAREKREELGVSPTQAEARG